MAARLGSTRDNGPGLGRLASRHLRSNSMGSHSSRRVEDDENALIWAALEKLPTYDRVRKGILLENEANSTEVDVRSLGLKERRGLLERLVGVAEEDNEKFLLKLKQRMDQVGIENPKIEVRFENLNVKAEAYLGSRGSPSVVNHFLNMIEGALSFLHLVPSGKRKVSILNDLSGIIKPCRMTLLLGPPGCGKTTLLLALAGKIDSTLKVSGKVTYNGHGMHEFVPRRTSAYISQDDVHIAEMTVRETLAFSARCQGTGARYEMLMELARREKAAGIKPDPDIDLYMKASSLKGQEDVATDYILKILGLETCADNVIGDAMIRGISGGQKKRVTTGEMLVGPAKALFMDEISTGLDSSTTFQIVNSLRQSVHILGGTALIALLQPAPETYELFDDIILLSDGYIVYHGPREYIVEFFELIGFRCPKRKGVADFLQEVISRKDQQQYWTKEEPYHFISVKEFAEAFRSFHVGHRLQEELNTPFDRTNNHPAALTTASYGIGKMGLLKVCMSREYLLMKRNSFVYIARLIQIVLIASISMTVFLRTEMHHDTVEDGLQYLGALVLGIMCHWFNGFAELAMTVAKLPIFFKQRDFQFFPVWAYTLPACILKIPVSFVECAVWTGITYYVVGFDPNIERMLRQYLIFTLVSQMAVSLFRVLAALGRKMVTAFTYVALTQIVLLALGGFVLSRDNIRNWWIWGYWSSPFMYATNAIAVNELLGNSWSHIPNITTGEPLGVLVLKSRGIFTESYWYWIGVGALIAYLFVLNFLFTWALIYINPTEKGQTISSEPLKENIVDITRENMEASPLTGKNSSFQENVESSIVRNATKRKKQYIPFSPQSITFEDIKYSIDMPNEMKVQGITEERLLLLNGLTGAFRPGVLTALMGASGAGKTTLMDVLSGRKTGGYIEGSIKISGYPKNQETFARISGYCEQTDIHSPHVTVYESIVYSAWLRLAPEVDDTTRKLFIEEVMELVEMTSLSSAMVGLPGVNGLSTEQRKRLTIAVELVANPSIIFMDEPTSGLDARAAAIVMRTVRNTVDTGRTVVCTIHQPSIDIFEAFDELFLMMRGGEEIYVGPLGHQSCNLIQYFEDINGVHKIKNGYNPATWMLEVTTSGQEQILGVKFAEVYKQSELFRKNKDLVTALSRPSPGFKELYFPTQYPQPFLMQCKICLWKQYNSYWRNPAYSATRIVFSTIAGLLYGSIFWKVGHTITSEQHLFNAMGSMYSAVMFLGVQNSQTAQPVVDVERTVFYREKAAGMYSAFPYAFAQVVIEIPYVLLQSIIYGTIVYAMLGFEWTAVKYIWFIFFVFTGLLYFTFYGMMMVALTPNSDIAAVVSSAFYGIWNLFAGFIVPRPRIPIWWRWYYWACPVSWTLYGLITSQYGDVKDVLMTGEPVDAFLSRYFGFEYDFLGAVAAAMIGFNLLFTLIFAYAIKSLNFQSR